MKQATPGVKKDKFLPLQRMSLEGAKEEEVFEGRKFKGNISNIQTNT